MTVRIISKDTCVKCKSYLARLDAQGFQYSKYDADAEENQKQLDEWNVDEVPVVHILADDGKILHPFPPGSFSVRAINHQIDRLKRQERSSSSVK